jgi:hypothetical protein
MPFWEFIFRSFPCRSVAGASLGPRQVDVISCPNVAITLGFSHSSSCVVVIDTCGALRIVGSMVGRMFHMRSIYNYCVIDGKYPEDNIGS